MRGPNMSYCMCENTLGALEQVIEALREQGPEEFFSQMSSYEREAFNNLVSACKEFVELNDEILDEEAADLIED